MHSGLPAPAREMKKDWIVSLSLNLSWHELQGLLEVQQRVVAGLAVGAHELAVGEDEVLVVQDVVDLFIIAVVLGFNTSGMQFDFAWHTHSYPKEIW